MSGGSRWSLTSCGSAFAGARERSREEPGKSGVRGEREEISGDMPSGGGESRRKEVTWREGEG